MIRTLQKQIATWLYRQSQKRHARKRLHDLEQRLLMMDRDIPATQHMPPRVRHNLSHQRAILIAQIENLEKNSA